MLIGKIMVTAGGFTLGSLLCHQRLKRQGQELTHARAKVMLMAFTVALCGTLVCISG